jgi:hypothetical protein
MLSMLSLLFVQSPIAQLDALAQKRDLAGILAMAAKPVLERPYTLDFIKKNGAYEVGSRGWHAKELRTPSGKSYVVFTTDMTSESIGEQVFEWTGGKLGRYLAEEDRLGHTIRHHSFDIRFDVPNKKAVITDAVTIEAVPGAPKEFLMRFSPNYRVSQIRDAHGKSVPFSQAGGVVALPTGGPGTFTLSLNYEAIVNLPFYAGAITGDEANLANDYWYPMIARWPATFEARVTTPPGWTVVTQGDLVQRTGDVSQFRMNLPVVYFSLTAAPFRQVASSVNGREFRVWSTSLSEDQMRIQATLNQPIIEFYEKSFGPYPFKSWGSLISKHYGGGALEAYSYATYGEGWLPDEDAHEPAHTWWGGIINNTYLTSLWNESFANFSAGLYRREGPIGNVEEKRPAFVEDAFPEPAYQAASCAEGGAKIGDAAQSLGYGKGAQVLQMLESEIGTTKMIACMREWIKSHPKGTPGNWEDFRKVCVRMLGQKIDSFFAQWLWRKGWPDFDVAIDRVDNDAIRGRVLWKSQPYTIDCEVLVGYKDGSREFGRVQLGSTPWVLKLPRPKPVEFISFDPWRRLLRRYGNDEAPVSIEGFIQRAHVYVDPAHTDWMSTLGQRRRGEGMPADLGGTLIVGSPETMPAMRPLCAKAGFEVKGNKLTYRGTTIDLDRGGAIAVVDLDDGKSCVIALGKTLLRPRVGRARTAIVDAYGRFLRGKTDPKTHGFLTFRPN